MVGRPLDDELGLRREVAQNGRDGERLRVLVRRHDQEGIGVAAEHRRTGDAVDGIATGEIPFREVGGDEHGGAGVVRELFELVQDLGHLCIRILLTVAVSLVNGVDDNEAGTDARSLAAETPGEPGDLVFFAATIPHVEAAEVAGREAATGAHETDALAVAEFRDLQVDVEDRGSAGREAAPRATEGDGDGEVGEIPRLPGLGRTGDDHLGALEQNALDELRRIRLVLGAERGRGDDVAGVLVHGLPIGERRRAEIDGEEALHALAAQTAGATREAGRIFIGLVDLEAG